MLSRRRSENDRICVLTVTSRILDLDDVIVSDCNAARGWARFSPVDEGLARLDAEMVCDGFWLHDDALEQDRHKGIKCAEVLVPDRVLPEFLTGAYVANREALEAFREVSTLPVRMRADMFF